MAISHTIFALTKSQNDQLQIPKDAYTELKIGVFVTFFIESVLRSQTLNIE